MLRRRQVPDRRLPPACRQRPRDRPREEGWSRASTTGWRAAQPSRPMICRGTALAHYLTPRLLSDARGRRKRITESAMSAACVEMDKSSSWSLRSHSSAKHKSSTRNQRRSVSAGAALTAAVCAAIASRNLPSRNSSSDVAGTAASIVRPTPSSVWKSWKLVSTRSSWKPGVAVGRYSSSRPGFPGSSLTSIRASRNGYRASVSSEAYSSTLT